jgi:predicted ribosomally synthesized peptide with SipW-like signal peptide
MKKNTKRALVATLLVMILSLTVLVGSTFAYFNDVVTGSGTISTGELNTKLSVAYDEEGNQWTDLAEDVDSFSFTSNAYKPGDHSTIWIKLENVGSLTYDLVYKMKATSDNFDVGENTYNLTSQFKYTWTVVSGATGADVSAENAVEKQVTNNDIVELGKIDDVLTTKVVVIRIDIRMIDSATTLDGATGDTGLGGGSDLGEQSNFDGAFAELSAQNVFMNKTITFNFNIEALQNTGAYITINDGVTAR